MDFDLLSTRVSHHLATGREAEAVELLKEHLLEHQGSAEFWVLYSAGLLDLDRFAEAEQTARSALSLEPENPAAGLYLSISLIRQSLREPALQEVYRVIETWPEFAAAHHLLGMILVGSATSRDDRRLARRATEHALSLEPSNPDFYHGAALAADLDENNRAALEYLREGLRLDPHHQGLLRYAASIENGGKVVGDSGALLRGMLTSDPTNQALHADFAEQYVRRQSVYANRFWMLLPLLACLAAFAGAADGAGRWALGAGILAVSALFALWNRTTYNKSVELLPSGYLRDIFERHPLVPRALHAYQWSWALGLCGALLGGFTSLQVPSAGLLLLAMVGSQLAGFWIGQELAGVPRQSHEPSARRNYMLRRSGMLAQGFWKRVFLALFNLALFGFCVEVGSRLAAVPLAAVGLGFLAVAVPLLVLQVRMGFGGNAFAYGQRLSSSAKWRGLAMVRGNLGAVCYIGIHLVVGLLASIMGLAVLLQGIPDTSSPSPTPAQIMPKPSDLERTERELQQLHDILQEQRKDLLDGPEQPSLPAAE
ncbi:hypothetical protein [Glutamicibacter protophormiae]|uniref:hypothetical protein n=1 Tax=Glutamicibacter protophormiae TaxID=37930 RepID=UPI003328360E